MHNRKFIKLFLILFVISILLFLMFSYSAGKNLSVTNPYFDKNTPFTTPSSTFTVGMYINFKIPPSLLKNVTITTCLKLYKLDYNGSIGMMILNYTTHNVSFTFNQKVNPGPGSYCLKVGAWANGNKSNANSLNNSIDFDKNNFIFYTSLIMEPNFSYLYIATTLLLSSLVLLYGYFFFGRHGKFL
ncbi:MAG: hypothetical protein M1427_07085 [Candidatus Thermoplasmatota archaeon]|nr:hypothetical protein [Candidatus Thermoplasmatota archaeon]